MARLKTGTVTSTKMQKTVVVTVTDQKPHPIYKKSQITSKKYHAHLADTMTVKEGDKVTISETIPRSKTVKWEVVENHNS